MRKELDGTEIVIDVQRGCIQHVQVSGSLENSDQLKWIMAQLIGVRYQSQEIQNRLQSLNANLSEVSKFIL